MTPKQFGTKAPAEVVTLTFDFVTELGAAAILTKVCACTVLVGTDPAAGAMINGAAQLSGGLVFQSVQAGVAFADYLITCTVTTNDSRTLVLPAILPVR